jgi:hypothetical protein
MSSKSVLSRVAIIYGIVVTLFFCLIFGTKLISLLIENGIGELKEIAKALIHWYDDPTAFFFSYIIGYAIVWWKPLWGSIIIIAGSLLVFIINFDNMGFLIFALLAFTVGFLYIMSWYDIRKRNKIHA